MDTSVPIIVNIPKEIGNVKLPDPEVLSYYQFRQSRILWLDSEIDDMWLEYLKEIAMWNMEDTPLDPKERKPITLMLFSYGGDLNVTMALVDAIAMSKTPITTVNVGQCCSGGAIIYLAGHHRYSFENATFMLHKGGASGIEGTADQIKSYQEQYEKTLKKLSDYIVLRTDIPKGTVTKKMKGEWYIDAKESLEHGVTHKIVQSFDEIFV